MKRTILVARHYSIEPLGILYLAGKAREVGCECRVVLIRDDDFSPLYAEIAGFRPDVVGFQIWTGGHLPMFKACDQVRRGNTPVLIGGPHATYFGDECLKHAKWVIKGGAFGLFAKLLRGELSSGLHFDKSGRGERFPRPDRDVVYNMYPELALSSIKSMFGEVGCPFECTYCYAPAFNEMHGGFKLTARPIDDLIIEAQDLISKWPCEMIYFQDDIFGFNLPWLEEFTERWPKEVGLKFHCQIRLELTKGIGGDRRLDLFAKAGCTGITLAIESGNAFLRDHVLFRHMPDELILEGCKKIMDRGMTLRTEQILAVPFSSSATDLITLDLNSRINPTMAWTSILAPYQGTDMGVITKNFGFYGGNNDDLSDSFFDRSILSHVKGGPLDIEIAVQRSGAGPKEHALLKMRAVRREGSFTADVIHDDKGALGEINFLSDTENRRYQTDSVRLQRLFNFLARVPEAQSLGRKFLEIPEDKWSWEEIGRVTEHHLLDQVGRDTLGSWRKSLAGEMGLSEADLPDSIATNPYYFCFFPGGGVLAQSDSDMDVSNIHEALDNINTKTRRHLFATDLYKVKAATAPIAKP